MAGQSADKGEVLPQGKLGIQSRLVPDQRDASPDGEGSLLTHLVAKDGDGTLSRPKEGGEHPKQSRLAGPVWTDDADGLAGRNLEVNAGQHWNATVPDGDVLQLNNGS
jgi:hypothetical protein